MIRLATSANAAQALSDQIRIATENTAKWLAEADREADRLRRIDQLRRSLNRSSWQALIGMQNGSGDAAFQALLRWGARLASARLEA